MPPPGAGQVDSGVYKQSLGGIGGPVKAGEEPPQGQERVRREPHELDPAVVQERGLPAWDRQRHGAEDDGLATVQIPS